MTALPRYTPSGAVVFDNDEDLRASLEAYLSKGSLAVSPGAGLTPLATLEVRLEGAWLTGPVPIRCEVVVLQPERALLRVLQPAAEELRERIGAPVVIAPPPSAEQEEEAEPTVLPPALAGEVLRFWSENDFNAAGRDLYTRGAITAVVDEGFVAGARRTVRLQVQDRLSHTFLEATLQPGQGGMAVVQFDDKDQLATVLPDLLPPKTPPELVEEEEEEEEEEERRPARVALTLPPSGALQNPASVEELLALSLARSLAPEDLERPNIHLLLRWLLGTHGNVRVEVDNPDAPVHPFVVIGGREIRSSVAMPTLARGLVGRQGRYETFEVKRPPRMTQSGTMLQLMQEVLSALVAHFDDEALEAGLRDYGARAPQLNAVGKRLLEGLGFSSSHKRLALKALTGKESVRSVTQHAAGARTAFEVLYTLEISGALDWVDAEGVLHDEKRRKEKERLDRLVEGAAGLWEKLQGANHFEVLGLHWSTPPRKIADAHQELRGLYGPAGVARAEAPEVCARIWDKMERAYEVLENTAERRIYRRQVYALKWSAQVELLVDRAKIAIYRKDLAEAVDLLSVCQDIQPTQEAADLLAKLKAKGRTGGA